MSDVPFQPVVDAETRGSAEAAEPVRTGMESIDRVLDRVESLGDVPVEDHVAVFERAHEELRGALDAQDRPAPPGQPG